MAQATGASLAPYRVTAYPQPTSTIPSQSYYGPYGDRPERPLPRLFNPGSPFLRLPLELRQMIYEYCAAADSELRPPTFRHSRTFAIPYTRPRRYDFTLHNLLATGPLCEEVLEVVPRYLPLYVGLGSQHFIEFSNPAKRWEKMVIREHRQIVLGIHHHPAAELRRNLRVFCTYYDEVQRLANPLKILHIRIDEFLQVCRDRNDSGLLEDLEDWIDGLSNAVMMKTWLDCPPSVDRTILAVLGAPNGLAYVHLRRMADAILRMRRHWA